MHRPVLRFLWLTLTLAVGGCAPRTSASRADGGSTQPSVARELGRADTSSGAPDVDAGWTAFPAVGPGCHAYGSALCNLYEQCEAGRIESYFGTHALCVVSIGAICTEILLLPTLDAGDTDMFECAASLAREACLAFELYDLPMFCGVSGPLEDGAACRFGPECKTGYCDWHEHRFDSCGVCGAPQPKGSLCGSLTQCGPEAACVAAHCSSPQPLGETCIGFDDCLAGLRCIAGRCQPGLHEGEPCASAVFPCSAEEKLRCDKTADACVRDDAFPREAPGEPCGPLASCRADGYCDPASGLCTLSGSEGAACESKVVPCQAPLSCVEGTCRYRPLTFKACSP